MHHILSQWKNKEKKKNGRIRIGSGPYKTAQNGDHIVQTKTNSDHQSHRKWGPDWPSCVASGLSAASHTEVGSGDPHNHHVLPLSLQHLHLVMCMSNVRPLDKLIYLDEGKMFSLNNICVSPALQVDSLPAELSGKPRQYPSWANSSILHLQQNLVLTWKKKVSRWVPLAIMFSFLLI